MISRRHVTALLLAASTLPLSQLVFPGCATMLSGSRQEVRIRSKPAAAQVFVNNRLIGTTPTAVFVSRWGVHRVRIEMPGYLPYEVKLEKTVNSNASGNIFLGGAWIVVDVLTGAVFEQRLPGAARDANARARDLYDPPQVFNFSPPLYIATHLKLDPSARKIGQMQRR
jgi:hypothetical protein